jgi:hypothetical protein
MHDLKDSQTGRYAGKHDRSMRTTRPGPRPKPNAPVKKPFIPKRKAAPSK